MDYAASAVRTGTAATDDEGHEAPAGGVDGHRGGRSGSRGGKSTPQDSELYEAAKEAER